MSFFFRAAYLVGFKPWDSGVPPPQLVAVVEGSNALLPQKALDLGCGTGTNSIYMARHGWDVTGIDFVPRAVTIAKRKAAEAQASPRLMVGDVTRLTELGIGTDYSLLLDLGCFHSIPDAGRDAYVRGVTALARAGATFLIFGFVRGAGKASRIGPRGLAPAEVAQRFAGGWNVDAENRGGPMFGSAAYWYTLHRR
ncbi:MAG: class I SAM-dependent methyltransferase [Candidatus Dormibacteraceae bacterium]